jgi:hypothetical protein
MTETETSLTAANDLAIRRPWSWPASSPSTRMAAGRASVSANLSGQNNPNKKQLLEIALEREGFSFIAELGGAAGEEAAARLVLILRNEAKTNYSNASIFISSRARI